MPLSRIYFLLFAFCNQTVAKIVTHTLYPGRVRLWSNCADQTRAHTLDQPKHKGRHSLTLKISGRWCIHSLIISIFIHMASAHCTSVFLLAEQVIFVNYNKDEHMKVIWTLSSYSYSFLCSLVAQFVLFGLCVLAWTCLGTGQWRSQSCSHRCYIMQWA